MLASHSCFCSFSPVIPISYQNICKMFLFTSTYRDDDNDVQVIEDPEVTIDLEATNECCSASSTSRDASEKTLHSLISVFSSRLSVKQIHVD